MHLTNGSLSTFLKDVLAMKLFEAQGPHINVWSHWIHFLHMFTQSQTGLEKAVGEGCLVINSPACTGRILLFPSHVLVTDLGTIGLEQHALKVLCMLMCLLVKFSHSRLLCVIHMAAACYKSWSVRHLGHLVGWISNHVTVTTSVWLWLKNFVLMSSSSLFLCFPSPSTMSCNCSTLDK